MISESMYIAALGVLNTAILSTVLINTARISSIKGQLKNGDYFKCPFYKGKVNNMVKKGNKNESC